jgi:hypothetical protein
VQNNISWSITGLNPICKFIVQNSIFTCFHDSAGQKHTAVAALSFLAQSINALLHRPSLARPRDLQHQPEKLAFHPIPTISLSLSRLVVFLLVFCLPLLYHLITPQMGQRIRRRISEAAAAIGCCKIHFPSPSLERGSCVCLYMACGEAASISDRLRSLPAACGRPNGGRAHRR